MTAAEEDRIVREVANSFASFGGGRGSAFNPIGQWMKDKPPVFALGVDIREVVRFVVSATKKRRRRAKCDCATKHQQVCDVCQGTGGKDKE